MENNIKELLQKFQQGDCTKAELEVLDKWYEEFDKNSEADKQIEPLLENWEGYVQHKFHQFKALKQKYRILGLPFGRLRIAAVLAVMIGLGILFFLPGNKSLESPKMVSNRQDDALPGKVGAILTLSDGQKIILDSSDGLLAAQSGVKIANENGTLVYKAGKVATKIAYNTLTTPNARQYQLVLPDGTRVWLNAGSSITYPVAFNGKFREVTIKGEAYLKVIHNERMPFRVNVRNHIIEDIGTEFNVTAYDDDESVKTTLVEGAVKINKVILKPGQQAIMSRNEIQVKQVDAENLIAWKDGYFVFNNTPLEEVMKQLSRWYNVEIVYHGKIPDIRFSGGIDRRANASQVLAILEESNVHFKIDNQKIIVTE